MKARIEEIRIQNFRALENVRLRVGDLTFLVGRNGAGKSSILDAIEFMREALTEGLHTALDRRDGFWGVHRRGSSKDSPIGLAVVLKIEVESGLETSILYGFQITQEPREGLLPIYHLKETLRVLPPLDSLGFERDKTVFSSSQNIAPVIAEDFLAFVLVAQAHVVWHEVFTTLSRMRAYELNPSVIRTATPIGSATYLLRDGSNSGDVLHLLQSYSPPEYQWLTRHIMSVADGIKLIYARADGGRRTIHFLQEPPHSLGDSFDASKMSHGTLRAVGILLALCQYPQPSLVLIDEIEDSMHPLALQVLLEAAESRADRFPVVLTTHSPEVLGTKQVTPDRVRILQWSQGVSRLYPLSAGTKKSVDSVTTVGDLLRYNALWPDDSPETFTGDILEL